MAHTAGKFCDRPVATVPIFGTALMWSRVVSDDPSYLAQIHDGDDILATVRREIEGRKAPYVVTVYGERKGPHHQPIAETFRVSDPQRGLDRAATVCIRLHGDRIEAEWERRTFRRA